MWQPRVLGLCVLACLASAFVTHSGYAAAPSAHGSPQAATGAASDSDPYWNVRGPLRDLLPSPGAPAPVASLDPDAFPVLLGDRVGVTIRTLDVNGTLDTLFGLGLAIGNMRGNVLEVYLSIPEIVVLARRPEVFHIEAIVPAVPTVTSQGQGVHNANNWIAGGIRGNGVKVGIIDAGFAGIQRLMGTEVPSSVTGRCYTLLGVFTPLLLTCEGSSPHGTAVAETIADIAPGVQLYVSQPVSRLDFMNAVDWMVSQGVSVINYSGSWVWDGPGDGTSPYPDSPLRAVDAAVARGTTFVSSAGNSGLASWLGPWRDADGDNLHEFSTTPASELNQVILTAGARIDLEMRWHDSWTAAATDLDLALVNSAGQVVGQSTNRQAGRVGDTPLEYFSAVAPVTGSFYVRVTRAGGPAPAWLQMQAYNFVPLQFATAGSIGSPAESASPGLMAVGAASWSTPSTIQPYSSVGPTPDGRIKPDIVAADQGATVSYQNFGGTSQASAHLSGLAALVKSAFPAFTPAQVTGYLKSNALPRGTSRPNNTWGWGFARLPNLCTATVTPASVSLGEAAGTLQFSVATLGSCAWSASSQAPWLTITSSAAGVGSGSVTVSMAGNTGAPRTGTLVIANTGVTVSQHGPGLAATNPRDLAVSVSGTVATLTWLPPVSDYPTGYVLEAGTQPGLSDLARLTLGTGLSASFEATNGAYYARVRSMFGTTTSPPSNEVTFRIGPPPPPPPLPPPPTPPTPPTPPQPPAPPGGMPSAPLNFGATASGANVSFTWSPPSSGAAGLTTFVLEAGSQPGLSNLATLNVAALSLFVPNVPPGRFFLRVRAANAFGLGPPSHELELVVASGGLLPPSNPTNLTNTVVGSTVTLRWQPPGGGGAPSGYVIAAGSAPGLSNLAVVPIGVGDGFMAQGVPRGVYYVRLAAFNAAGHSGPSNETVITVP